MVEEKDIGSGGPVQHLECLLFIPVPVAFVFLFLKSRETDVENLYKTQKRDKGSELWFFLKEKLFNCLRALISCQALSSHRLVHFGLILCICLNQPSAELVKKPLYIFAFLVFFFKTCE